MKAFIIYNKTNEQSEKIAKECLDSFGQYKNWEVALFNGCSPKTLPTYEEKHKLTNGRCYHTPGKGQYATKKSCFYSHFELWYKCAKLDEPIVIVEHDAECVRDFSDEWIINDGAMQIDNRNVDSEKLLRRNRDYTLIFNENGKGIHPIFYYQVNKEYQRMIGNVGYMITPSACRILINNCNTHGWLINDRLITTKLFPLYYIYPPLVKYCPNKELNLSIAWK